MIILALALAAATLPAPITADKLLSACEEGVSGNSGSATRCKNYISDVAKTLENEGESGCLSQPAYNADEAVWAFMDWAAENPPQAGVDAAAGVMTSLVSKWPCGWSSDLKF